jgi:8-oxo-dGTP pyrophosphatase MutT (NUDIX family)
MAVPGHIPDPAEGSLPGPERSEPTHSGVIIDVRMSYYRRPDGTEVRREVLEHPGAVVVVPVEDDRVLMVRQPREAVERLTLELPAGKLDVPGEEPLECARRELAEEAGRAAARWTPWGGFFTAPAILTEYIHCFLAEDLSPVDWGHADADEDIEVVAWPLADLDALIARVEDAKSLVGLLRLRALTG